MGKVHDFFTKISILPRGKSTNKYLKYNIKYFKNRVILFFITYWITAGMFGLVLSNITENRTILILFFIIVNIYCLFLLIRSLFVYISNLDNELHEKIKKQKKSIGKLKQQYQIQIPKDYNEPFEIKVYNSDGKEIFTEKLKPSKDNENS